MTVTTKVQRCTVNILANVFIKHSVPCQYVISFIGLLAVPKFYQLREKFMSKCIELSFLIMSIMDKVRNFYSIKQLVEF